MTELLKFFEDLKNNTKPAAKKEVLARATDVEKALLLASLDPNRNYYVSRRGVEIGTGFPDQPSRSITSDMFFGLLNKLNSRQLTGNDAKQAIQNFFTNFPSQDDAVVYARVLFREALGVDAKTVNSVYKDLIPEFNVMLAPSKTPALEQLKYPLFIQPKLDGLRAIVFYDPQEGVEIFTRTGKTIENRIIVKVIQENLQLYLEQPLKNKPWVFDGEIYVHGWPFKKIYGAASTEVTPEQYDAAFETKDAFNEETCQLEYFVWDVMAPEEWSKKHTEHGYMRRYNFLTTMYLWNRNDNPEANYSNSIRLVPIEMARGPAEVLAAQRRFLSEGYEGTMLKSPEGRYQWKRVTPKSGELMKYKEFKSVDLQVTGYAEGEGKYQGKLGILQVSFKGNTVGVGSGYTDAQRDEFWKKRDDMVGKIIEVKYFEETTDDQGRPSLRFPIFQRMREDRHSTTEG